MMTTVPSILPGMVLDVSTGEIAGSSSINPAVTKEYKSLLRHKDLLLLIQHYLQKRKKHLL